MSSGFEWSTAGDTQMLRGCASYLFRFRELSRVCNCAGQPGSILEEDRAVLWGLNPSSSCGAAFLGYLRCPRLGRRSTHRSGGLSFRKWVLRPGLWGIGHSF